MGERRAPAETCGEPSEGKTWPTIQMQEVNSVAAHEPDQIPHHKRTPAPASKEDGHDSRRLEPSRNWVPARERADQRLNPRPIQPR